jgi:dTDP-4-dehydrorhamnose reductase
MKMNILVLGASGMAGHVVSLYFIEKGHDVHTFSISPLEFGENIVGNALNHDTLESVVLEREYDAVINCIGILNKNCDSETADAIYLNSYLPHFVSELLHEKRTKFIQISTDCVFSGRTGSYYETSFPDGETFYERTKALGEINDARNLTFRSSLIGPDMNPGGIGLFNWFMKQSDTIQGFTKVIWTGVTTNALARAIEKAIELNLCGIYHLVNNEIISKFELLNLFNNYVKDSKLTILPDNGIIVNKSLINTRSDFSFSVPSYAEMVLEMNSWIINHRELYPHYYL